MLPTAPKEIFSGLAIGNDADVLLQFASGQADLVVWKFDACAETREAVAIIAQSDRALAAISAVHSNSSLVMLGFSALHISSSGAHQDDMEWQCQNVSYEDFLRARLTGFFVGKEACLEAFVKTQLEVTKRVYRALQARLALEHPYSGGSLNMRAFTSAIQSPDSFCGPHKDRPDHAVGAKFSVNALINWFGATAGLPGSEAAMLGRADFAESGVWQAGSITAVLLTGNIYHAHAAVPAGMPRERLTIGLDS